MASLIPYSSSLDARGVGMKGGLSLPEINVVVLGQITINLSLVIEIVSQRRVCVRRAQMRQAGEDFVYRHAHLVVARDRPDWRAGARYNRDSAQNGVFPSNVWIGSCLHSSRCLLKFSRVSAAATRLD